MLFKTKWGIGKHNGMWHVFEQELFLFFNVGVVYIDTRDVRSTFGSPCYFTGLSTREQAIEYALERQEYRNLRAKRDQEEKTSWTYIS